MKEEKGWKWEGEGSGEKFSGNEKNACLILSVSPCFIMLFLLVVHSSGKGWRRDGFSIRFLGESWRFQWSWLYSVWNWSYKVWPLTSLGSSSRRYGSYWKHILTFPLTSQGSSKEISSFLCHYDQSFSLTTQGTSKRKWGDLQNFIWVHRYITTQKF